MSGLFCRPRQGIRSTECRSKAIKLQQRPRGSWFHACRWWNMIVVTRSVSFKPRRSTLTVYSRGERVKLCSDGVVTRKLPHTWITSREQFFWKGKYRRPLMRLSSLSVSQTSLKVARMNYTAATAAAAMRYNTAVSWRNQISAARSPVALVDGRVENSPLDNAQNRRRLIGWGKEWLSGMRADLRPASHGGAHCATLWIGRRPCLHARRRKSAIRVTSRLPEQQWAEYRDDIQSIDRQPTICTFHVHLHGPLQTALSKTPTYRTTQPPTPSGTARVEITQCRQYTRSVVRLTGRRYDC